MGTVRAALLKNVSSRSLCADTADDAIRGQWELHDDRQVHGAGSGSGCPRWQDQPATGGEGSRGRRRFCFSAPWRVSAGVAGAQSTPATPAAEATPGTPAAVAAYQPVGPQVERLTFWTRSSPDTSRNEWDALTAVATRYTELVGTPIELITVPDADFRSRMTLAAPSGDGPDVFGPVAHDWLGEFAVQNIAQTWAPDAIHGASELSQSSLAAVSVDGQLYGIPLFSEALALMYNTNLCTRRTGNMGCPGRDGHGTDDR